MTVLGTRARIASAREGGTIMKLGICIAILFLALAGGVASAITAELLPAMLTLAAATAVRPRQFPTTSGAAHGAIAAAIRTSA